MPLILVPFTALPPPPAPVTVQDPQRILIFTDGATTVKLSTIESVTTQVGRSSPRSDGAATGTASITLDDTARILDPDNTSSPLYGHLTPGGSTIVQLWSYGTSWMQLFTGGIESIQTSWPGGTSRSEAVVTLADSSRDLNLHIPPADVVYPLQQSGARIGQMIRAPSRSGSTWVTRSPGNLLAIDSGQKVLGALTTDGTTSTWQYVSDAASAEKGLVFFGPSGTLTYQDQMHRYRSATPTWVFGDDPSSEIWVEPDLQYMLSNDRIVTDVAYATSDGWTTGYGASGAFFWTTDGTVSSTQISGVPTQLADQMQALGRARWEYTHYSINRRDAPQVTINALGEWPSTTGTSRYGAATLARIGDYVRLNRRPGDGTTLTKYYWIDAIAQSMSFGNWTTTFTLAAADQITSVWKLGTTKLSDVTAPLPW